MTAPWEQWLQISNSPEFTMTERTLSVWHRHQIELTKLNTAWSTVAVRQYNGIISGIGGSVRTASGYIRDFRIDVPGTYPYDGPRAYAVGWNPGSMHTYEGSELCLWRPGQWSPRHTLAYAVGKAFTWIHKHDVYIFTNLWPGKGQAH
ncbi:hypothetical protein AMIS_51610 [Actinoplanes missouriensis 431]|uniref:Type II CBASS E2 protein domain-containing protein n=1 Tax=Actinoplanes missouriensis (strain ATCC 14538 / DSM 43046 / CBS 188.64 / JCM 3121 / NBRC 102363 / NCIMB 12654 / NRRL B-3342 / UNCC 431) TaxID=512565 RepID=I0HBJ4_ACTM4|nr:hypothetical protein [Actinoplanes missouriensis]BAL90381.1 hypothetical protein AMIS_51610 [Actinoplanes missouriensis 431]